MSNKVVFDIDRMGKAAHELYSVRTKLDALAQRASRIEPHGVKDPVMRSMLETGARRMQLMAAGDARELAACEHSVRGAVKRALAADAPSKRASRAKRKRRPKKGGKVRPSGQGKRLPYPGKKAGQQQMACWLASKAGGMGAPPELLVTAALVESSLRNVEGGDARSTGLFQIQVSIHKVPPGYGAASGTFKDEAWWTNHPEAQLKWFAGAVRQTDTPGRGPGTTGAQAIGDWAAAIERPRADLRGKYAQAYPQARRLVSNCHGAGGSGSGVAVGQKKPSSGAGRPVPGTTKRARLGARIASNAKRMIGIERKGGAFTQMQRRVGSPNSAAWCAAYVYSAVLKSGKKLPGGGWAAVGNWVKAARARRNGLSIVSAGEAKAGDIVCYDWDGGSDFYGKSHIGVLESDVSNGRFTTVEGNTNNGVSTTRDRSMGVAENVVFIRVSP